MDNGVSWIFIIVIGAVIGLIGKFVAPGSRDNTPLWLTLILGMVGTAIGYGIFGGTKGFDVLAFVAAVVISAVLVVIAATVTGRNSRRV